MKLSVVICLYNTDEKYFENCLKSVRRSTLAADDYEILVINDGSDKDYSRLFEKYSPRVIRTENRGIFKARLLGIREALGDYIAFVDSDDTVSINYHMPMLKYALENGTDIVFNDWAFHTDRTRYCCMADSTLSRDFSVSGDAVLLEFARQGGREHAYFVLWNKLFKGEILKKSAEFLWSTAEEVGKYNYSEDALINFFAFKGSKSTANIHTGYYFYRKHEAQSINVISEESLASKIKLMSKTLDIMLSNIGENAYADEISESIKKWKGLMSRAHYSHAKANKYYHLFDFIKECYHVDKLCRSKFKDSSAYSKNRVLPMNFEKIDEALLRVWESGEISDSSALTYAYTAKFLDYMRAINKEIKLSPSGAVIPKPKFKTVDKILMNDFVYTAGLIFFKKGSKIREFLKRHI